MGQAHDFVHEEYGGGLFGQVNSYIFKDTAPPTIQFGGLSIIPSEAMMVQRYMLCLVPFNTIKIVSKVENHS
jgi:hypothetical protein